MLRITDLQYRHPGPQGRALSFPDFSVAQGEHFLILGNSGCGKTTLLHLLGGLLSPQQGQIWVGDTDIARLPSGKLDRFRGQHIGIIFQKPHYMRALSVRDNLLAAQYLGDMPKDEARVQYVLEHLNVAHRQHAKMQQLSEGEKQRVAVAMALVNNPSLILADEPTASLDDVNAREVVSLLERQASEQGATLVIVTHDHRIRETFPNQLLLQPPV